jgi:hypothetical protein
VIENKLPPVIDESLFYYIIHKLSSITGGSLFSITIRKRQRERKK